MGWHTYEFSMISRIYSRGSCILCFDVTFIVEGYVCHKSSKIQILYVIYIFKNLPKSCKSFKMSSENFKKKKNKIISPKYP